MVTNKKQLYKLVLTVLEGGDVVLDVEGDYTAFGITFTGKSTQKFNAKDVLNKIVEYALDLEDLDSMSCSDQTKKLMDIAKKYLTPENIGRLEKMFAKAAKSA